MLLGELIERNANLSPHREAIVDGVRRYTFSQYAERVRRLASALEALGVRRQDRVAILAMNCAEYVETYGACELAGFIIATLNFRLADPELDYVLADSAPAVLIFEAQYAQTVARLKPKLSSNLRFVCIGSSEGGQSYEDLIAAGNPHGPSMRARESDYLALIYTSGTTGKPKGVIRTQTTEAHLAARMAGDLGYSGDGRTLLTMPLFHMGARGMQLGQHWVGGTCVIQRRYVPAQTLSTIEAERITHVHFAPSMFQELLDAPQAQATNLSSLRTLSYSAAPMPVPLLRRGIKELGPIFVNLYGATEANATCLQKHEHILEGPPHVVKRLGSLGQIAIDAELRIVDDQGNDCPQGTAGEIAIKAPWAMAGYWNNDVATAAAIRDGWVFLGDIGYLDEEGYLFLVDRKKDMIISGGENIYSREVETALLEHPSVVDAAVIGVPDQRWGERVFAVVVVREGMKIDEHQLIEHCTSLIARYKCPKSVEFVRELPRLPSGKVAKLELRRMYG